MFKITPIQDKNTHIEYAKKCGAEYVECAFAYGMYDHQSGEIMGLSQFEIYGKEALIFSFSEALGRDDFEAMFILARQTMNFIDLCGANTIYAKKGCANESFLKAVGFKPEGEKYKCVTDGMFDGNCGNH